MTSRRACFFASDLHGRDDRYGDLFRLAREEVPAAVFLGGDLLPAGPEAGSFVGEHLGPALRRLRDDLGPDFPPFFLILGNDDPRCHAPALHRLERDGLCADLHMARAQLGEFDVYGYSFVPPTPFLLKDGERYDVSRHVDPGCVSPEEGIRTVPADPADVRWGTIARDLDRLTAGRDLGRAVFLFHAPPYRTGLDRAPLDGMSVDHAPLDVHIGSVAIRRFIEERGPWLTLHGHAHESARLTGIWKERIGRTWALSAAHDGPGLALVRFGLDDPEQAAREITRPAGG